jgi:murein DD-endopeptidase MepM/ murein hydrolase activator NlpD
MVKYMKKSHWFIYFSNPSSSDRMNRMLIGKTRIAICLVIMVFGFLGLCRCIYFGASYGYAKLGMHYNLKENRQLKLKLQFFQKFAKEKITSITELVSFEDKMRLKFGMETISKDVREAGVGGFPGPNEELSIASLGDPGVIKADSIKEKLSELLRQARLQDSTLNQVVLYAQQQSDMWAQRPSISPVWGRITSTFGYRVHPFTGAYILHEGLDISGAMGTPIKSPADGVVSLVGFKDFFGRVVMVDHPVSGFKTVFAHLNKAAVVEGQALKRGDILGYMGNSGRSTGPHLHFEVHKLHNVVNPTDFFLPTDVMID